MVKAVRQSSIALWKKCGVKFQRIILDGEREPPRLQPMVGTVLHKTAAQTLTRKLDHRTLPTVEEVQDLTADTYEREWQATDPWLSPEERAPGIDAVKGQHKDLCVALGVSHRTAIAPHIEPVAVEHYWRVPTEYGYDLTGTIDLIARDSPTGPGLLVRDLKKRSRTPSQKEVDHSFQLTLYDYGVTATLEEKPVAVALDCLVVSKSKPPQYVEVRSTRDARDYEILDRTIANYVAAIESGLFHAASPESDWWCDERYCGFAADHSCPYFRGRITVGVGQGMETRHADAVPVQPFPQRDNRAQGQDCSR